VILIVGTVRLPPENLDRARPVMEAMMAASRAEDGCLDYAYSHDLVEPGLVRVTEAWRDREALAAHFKAPHLAAWRAAWPELGIGERRLALYETAGPESI
jgi:quinol monooxygenase YgiN